MTKETYKYLVTIETNDSIPNVYTKMVNASNEAVAVITAFCQCKQGMEKVVKVEKAN